MVIELIWLLIVIGAFTGLQSICRASQNKSNIGLHKANILLFANTHILIIRYYVEHSCYVSYVEV